MNPRPRILVPLVCLFLTGVCTRADDWPKWRGPAENGIAGEALPAGADFSEVAFELEVGIGFSSFAVEGGKAFTMGHRGGEETVWCFDAATGEELWRDSYPAPLIDRFYEGGPGATPTVWGENVYTYSKHGLLRCYLKAEGKLVWERDMLAEAGLRKSPEWGFACSPYFLGDKLIIEAGATFALNPASGEVVWKGKDYTPAYGNPVSFENDGRTLVAVLKTEGLVVLDSADGKTVAETPWKTSFATNSTTPIVTGNEIFISTGYNRGCALFQITGDELVKRYENDSMSNHMNNCVLIDGHLYGFDGNAHQGRGAEFVCLDWATGEEKWRVEKAEGLGCGSVIADADGRLIILSEKGEMLAVPASPDGFKITVREQVIGGRCWTPPAFADGNIYVRNAKGDAVCVRVRK